ncbi:hypothetical protein [Pararcticibacter amylolyticus]|uniref:Lipoprotein n=1 Tax=Pararcticibacter amylolyticus TaxID=2173175 RepID=A0A2U2PBC5_9SPHI|nr:hypothetical protein [Pararcticibacter amylolyticus]PWG78701.1 hypothetical protein DDR33_21000 [Pararcticibacter amylolyticus]
MKNYTIIHTLCSFIIVLSLSCTSNRQPDSAHDHDTTHTQNNSTQHDTLSSTTAEPQSATEAAKAPANTEEIQKAYAGIMDKAEKGALDSTTFKYSCNGEKNGTVSYYTEKGRLRLIVHQYNEYDHYSATDRYFVQDSTLFFVHRQNTTWSFESGPEGTTRDNITEQRIYLVNQKPVKCLEKKYTVRSKAKNNPDPATIPNKETNCSSIKSVITPYQLLFKHRQKPTQGCLE